MAKIKYEITEELLEEIKSHAARGLNIRQIAQAIGWGKTKLYNTLNDNTDIADAIKAGAAAGLAQVANALFENAMKGNTTAQIFYLKNRAPDEWKDRVPEGAGGETPSPTSIKVVVVDGRAQ